MPWPMTPSLVTTSTSTSGDSAITPLAVRCGSGIGTRTARARSSRTVAVAARDAVDMRAHFTSGAAGSAQQAALAQDRVDLRPAGRLVGRDRRAGGEERAERGGVVAARLVAEPRAVDQPAGRRRAGRCGRRSACRRRGRAGASTSASAPRQQAKCSAVAPCSPRPSTPMPAASRPSDAGEAAGVGEVGQQVRVGGASAAAASDGDAPAGRRAPASQARVAIDVGQRGVGAGVAQRRRAARRGRTARPSRRRCGRRSRRASIGAPRASRSRDDRRRSIAPDGPVQRGLAATVGLVRDRRRRRAAASCRRRPRDRACA